jgi:hypothetical protein
MVAPRLKVSPCLANHARDGGVMNTKQLKLLSNICFFLGFASILGSIAIWFLAGGTSPDKIAHAERFGIFVGLWAPTFLILSNRFDRYADRVI